MSDTINIPKLELPSRITVTRSFTYNVNELAAELISLGNEPDDITEDYIIDTILEWAEDDMSSRISRHDIDLLNADTGEHI